MRGGGNFGHVHADTGTRMVQTRGATLRSFLAAHASRKTYTRECSPLPCCRCDRGAPASGLSKTLPHASSARRGAASVEESAKHFGSAGFTGAAPASAPDRRAGVLRLCTPQPFCLQAGDSRTCERERRGACATGDRSISAESYRLGSWEADRFVGVSSRPHVKRGDAVRHCG